MAEIIFKEHVITSSVVKISFVVDEITLKVAVCDDFFKIIFLVVKITIRVDVITS